MTSWRGGGDNEVTVRMWATKNDFECGPVVVRVKGFLPSVMYANLSEELYFRFTWVQYMHMQTYMYLFSAHARNSLKSRDVRWRRRTYPRPRWHTYSPYRVTDSHIKASM